MNQEDINDLLAKSCPEWKSEQIESSRSSNAYKHENQELKNVLSEIVFAYFDENMPELDRVIKKAKMLL